MAWISFFCQFSFLLCSFFLIDSLLIWWGFKRFHQLMENCVDCINEIDVRNENQSKSHFTGIFWLNVNRKPKVEFSTWEFICTKNDECLNTRWIFGYERMISFTELYGAHSVSKHREAHGPIEYYCWNSVFIIFYSLEVVLICRRNE